MRIVKAKVCYWASTLLLISPSEVHDPVVNLLEERGQNWNVRCRVASPIACSVGGEDYVEQNCPCYRS